MREFQAALTSLIRHVEPPNVSPSEAPSNFLVILYGAPCSGKTTIGRCLAAEYNAARLTMDDARDALLTDGDLLDKNNDLVFELFFAAAAEFVRRRRALVCEGVFAATSRRRRLHRLSEESDLPAVTIRCVAPLQDLLWRLDQRTRAVERGGTRENIISASKLQWFLNLYAPPLFEPLPSEVVVDTGSCPFAETIDRVRTLVSETCRRDADTRSR